MAELYLNGGFVGQRVTGQQRYASEVTAQLADRPSVRILRPPSAVAARPVLAHAWAHAALPVLARRGALLSLTARSPVLARRHTVVIHDLFVLNHPEWYSPAYVRTHAPVLAAQLRTAEKLVAVSEPVAAELRRLHPDKPVAVAPNAPSGVFRRASTAALPADVRAALEASGVEGFIFAVGSRDPRKNFGRLVEAYGLLPKPVREAFPLVIAGGQSNVFAAGFVQPSVGIRRLGYVSDEALAALYASATAVVIPSLDEGFGLPVVEALVAGARIAVSDIPAFRWVAEDAACYFDPQQSADIARVMREMLARRTVVGDTRAVASRFDWARTAETIVEFAGG